RDGGRGHGRQEKSGRVLREAPRAVEEERRQPAGAHAREGLRRAAMRLVAVLLAAWALGGLPLPAHADPAETDPDLAAADQQNDLGYAHRNLRQFDAAFRHYKRAIELEPRHRGAHEYIGEAYLMVGDVPNAERHLAALRAICLLPCEELTDLEKAFA